MIIVISIRQFLEKSVGFLVIAGIDEEIEFLVEEYGFQCHGPFRIIDIDKITIDVHIGIGMSCLEGCLQGFLDVHVDRAKLVKRFLSLIDGRKVRLKGLELP